MTTTTTNRPRIGPRMEEALAYVRAHPGCTKAAVAAYVAPNGSLRYGYGTVDRAISAGLITAQRGSGGRYALHARA